MGESPGTGEIDTASLRAQPALDERANPAAGADGTASLGIAPFPKLSGKDQGIH
jgi:hypothetical protein